MINLNHHLIIINKYSIMTLGAKSAEVLASRFRALSRIQAHRRIARVETQPVRCWVMKSAAGKALKDVREGDGAGVNKFNISKK